MLNSVAVLGRHAPTATRRPDIASTASRAGRPSPSWVCDARFSTQDGGSKPEESASRRAALLSGMAATVFTLGPAAPSHAIGFRKELKKRKLSPEDYSPFGEQLKVAELAEGRGNPVSSGDLVEVHFDCYFRGLDVVSTRSARLLGGNRTLAEPFQLVAGAALPKAVSRKVSFDDKAGGLYAAAGGPKPPPALPEAVIGMKVGGKRSVLVPAELAYGEKGILEIPPNTDIEMQIEMLQIKSQ
mmetsp:Transcript_10873/g.30806  ORF Transcript_10873/g.30806 Transcript_10873/m.30806 type:complete len:242 (+) Transcript_10873:139-864(+)